MTLGDALEEAGITLNPADEVDPPLSTTLDQQVMPSPITVTIARITETLEVIPESIPFERRIVRSAEMSPQDPPRILQTGVPGLQDVSVRIVYRNGLETERWPTEVSVVVPAVDEIIMLGVSTERDEMPVAGRLAYINDGRAIILEGSTDTPQQLAIDGSLDGRVFQLSPDGRYLLYTVEAAEAGEDGFHNELWVIPTGEGAQARPLQIENVLWAGWDPTALETPRIAYSTARSVPLPPGWEAINDLWLMALPDDGTQAAPIRVVESYPAAFGWWGGNYAWSPDGRRIAYGYADEIGLLDVSGADLSGAAGGLATAAEPARTVLHTYTPYDTGGDWAWLPALSWSTDGRYLAFNDYTGDGTRFDLRLVDTSNGNQVIPAEEAGIWSAVQWSPASSLPASHLASLRAVDPDESDQSSYALWLADADGSNARRVFPPEGEAGRFARTTTSLSWGPDENAIAFIFDDSLHILDVATGDIFRAGTDDTLSSLPTWAPYGAAVVP